MADDKSTGGKAGTPSPMFPTTPVKNVQTAPQTLGPTTSCEGKVSSK